ncbi:hypothetical protein MtrunA17_Chr4g0052241 [Medicago truncatula]|uniref:Transmembrane protein, putative n=1 Tax=Medicago truncatula TaxID=3880 RepID=G7JE00_MEDTR|nr:uncharacterized protein LOC11406846 [Medicago truncatula]AES90701.2 transmembrane protein, putative [Medicago truncatula]RHN62879.1 hypothetical protein MtrunA17_Chr4g0052241 [Medicago truncatula]
MEHYAIRLRCSPLRSPPLHLSYGSKRYEDASARGSKFHLKFNHATLNFPQFSASHQFARSFGHANCMINNSFSVPNSKNIEGSENKNLRGMSGVSLVLGCILGIINFSGMMNPKISMALPFDPTNIGRGVNTFDSLWNTINAEGVELNPKLDPNETLVDKKKMHALYLRNRGKKREEVEMVEKLKDEYTKSKEDDPAREPYLRKAVFELLLIQGRFDEACKLLDSDIDTLLDDESDKNTYSKFFGGSTKRVYNYEEKITKLLNSYNNDETPFLEKQAISDILLYKAIVHTKLKDKEAHKEAAKWWEAFAKTLNE